MSITPEILKESKIQQELALIEMCKLFEQLCDKMSPPDAFTAIFLAWASIAMQVKDHQPGFYKKFNDNLIPKVLTLILSTNRDTTAEILLDQINELLNTKTNDQ